jgi:hypothetical protein
MGGFTSREGKTRLAIDFAFLEMEARLSRLGDYCLIVPVRLKGGVDEHVLVGKTHVSDKSESVRSKREFAIDYTGIIPA